MFVSGPIQDKCRIKYRYAGISTQLFKAKDFQVVQRDSRS